MKNLQFLTIIPALCAHAAPLSRDSATEKKHSVRGTDLNDLVVVYDSDKVKRDSDIANVIRAVYDTDDKAKRGTDMNELVLFKAADKRKSDIANVIRAVYDTDDKAKRATDLNDLVRWSATDKRDDSASDTNTVIAIYDTDDHEKRDSNGMVKRKVVNPYTDDIDAADPHAILGE